MSEVGVAPLEHGARKFITPGAVNAHSHAFQRALRGHVQWRGEGDDSFWTWRSQMYDLVSALDPDGVEVLAEMAFMEMLEAGITTVGEFHYVHHGPGGVRYADPDEMALRVAAAAETVGIRLVLLRTAYHRAGFQREPSPAQLRFFDRDADESLAALERLRSRGQFGVGLAIHSVRAVGPGGLAGLAPWKGLVHAHVAEVEGELRESRAEHGLEPLAVLERFGWVRPGFSAVHLNRLGPGDVERMGRAGATLVACPTTEWDLGDGWVPVDLLTGPVAVGSDSQAVINPWFEARAVEWSARAVTQRRNILGDPARRDAVAHRLLSIATAGGHRALGGSGAPLEVGEPADVVVWDLDRAEADGVPAMEAIAFNGHPAWIHEVWVGGRRRVVSGRHEARDAIRARFSRWLRRTGRG